MWFKILAFLFVKRAEKTAGLLSGIRYSLRGRSLCNGAKDAVWNELTPAGPYARKERKTIVRVLIPNEIWALEQVQGAIFVHVPVRSIVVKLSFGGLLVYGAVAPTKECLDQLASLEADHGQVKHIILPTTATEHKLFAIALARKKSKALLWIAASQFSFPVNLPNQILGFPGRGRTRLLMNSAEPEFATDFSYLRLGPFFSAPSTPASFEEIVFYHKKTKALLCCDLLVSLSAKPPEILIQNDIRALYFHARAKASSVPIDITDGWKKICLFALYFQSSPLQVASEPDGTLSGALNFFRDAFPRPNGYNGTGWGNFFAWAWPDTRLVEKAFNALSADGALLIPPILSTTILNRRPADCQTFLEALENTCGDIHYVLPCHFDAPVKADLAEIESAFRAANLGLDNNVFSSLLPPLGTFFQSQTIINSSESSNETKDSPSSTLPPSTTKQELISVRGTTTNSTTAASSVSSSRSRIWRRFFPRVRVQSDGGPPQLVRRRRPLPDEDLAFLREFEESLVKTGAIEPRQ